MSLVQLDTFQVALTGDFFNEEGQPCFPDLGLSELEGHAGISCVPFAVHHQEIGPSQLAGVHGAIVLAPRVTRESVQGNEQLMAIGRYGVGYDSVDVEACTASDVLVYIASGAVDHSVAEATVGWMIALTHRFLEKDTLVRDARWNERAQFHGCELRNRRLGIIGLGGIGKALLKLLSQFGMGVPLAYDPALDPRTAENSGCSRSLWMNFCRNPISCRFTAR